MTEKITIRELIEKISQQAGITKKMAADILRTLPVIIEEGLKKDGAVKVKGLGTFRLKPVKGKAGRNPRTGARVQIPPHSKIVFLPEQSFKEFINQPYRMLGYQILDEKKEAPVDEIPIPEPPPPVQPEVKDEVQESHEPVPVPVYAATMRPPEPPEDPPPVEELHRGKKKIHWIIPVMLAIIVVLSLVYYLRNCERDEDSSQEAVVSSQETEVEAVEPVSEEPPAEPETELAVEPETPEPTFNIQHSTFNITEGNYLFRIASEVYGNPYLWPLIYKANQEIITDPELVIIGKEILIPALEGTPDRLTPNDSLEISEGYRLVYEYYREKGDPKADDFQLVMERYHPK
ncbi:MAG: HU family DNA-binding protein [Bacteroidales bacterium]|nr:HU family DNA-binding protein [Bacteroidales bacterium]